MSALNVEGAVEVRCTREAAWDLFCRFGDIAALIPSVEDVRVDGDRVHARVATKLGALPISSRVTLEVIDRKPFECLKARGMSYLGETIKEQIPKDVAGVATESVGTLLLHLDLRPGSEDGLTSVIYSAEVEASGRLKKIYQAILKTKVPAMMEQFAQNIRGALETAGPAAVVLDEEAVAVAIEVAPESAVEHADGRAAAMADEPAAVAVRRPGLWARFFAWARRIFARGA